MRAVWLLVLAGCLQSAELVPCGDLLCPVATTCLVDRCVTGGQLSSCVDKATGDACAVGERVGICMDGACTYIGCGNGVVDPGEVCDDANTTYADGCAGDCSSDETCGNGVVDYAAGEGCDCGVDETTRPARCRLSNTNASDGECTPDCQARYCGNGTVDVLEQCDGAELASATCREFGYYHGTPTCTMACVVSPSGCYGRCGDGDVEPLFGEYCDGNLPPGTCLTYGLDGGYLGCSDACSPGIDHCERFGWVRVEERPVIAVQALGAQTAIVSSQPDGATNAWLVINGVRSLAPAGTYNLIAEDGTRLFFVGAAHAAQWTGTAWSTMAVGWTGQPTAVAASVARGLYVAAGGTLWHYTAGSWVDQGLSGVVGVSSTAGEVLAWSGTQVWSEAGSGWTPQTLPALGATTIVAATRGDVGPLWLAANATTSSILLRRDPQTQVWMTRQLAGIVKSAGATLDGDLVTATTASGIIRVPASGVGIPEALEFPTSNPQAIGLTPDGELVSGGAGGSYRLRSGALEARYPILEGYAYDPYEYATFSSFTVDHDGYAMISGGDYMWTGNLKESVGPSRETYDLISEAPLDGGDAYLTDWGIEVGYSLVWETAIYDSDGNLVGSRVPRTMAPAPDGSVVVGGVDFVLRFASSGSSVVDVSGYDVYRLTVNASGTIGAVARSGSDWVLLRVDAADVVTELWRGATGFTDIWIAPTDDVVAIASSTIYRCGVSCTTEVAPVPLTSVSGTAMDDLFVGSNAGSGNFGPLTRWDGVRWAPLRTLGNGVRDLVVTETFIAYLQSGASYVRQVRIAKW